MLLLTDNNDQANVSSQSRIHRNRVRRQERRNAVAEHRGSVFNQENKQSEGALLCSAGRAWMNSVMEKTSYSVCVSASDCGCRVYFMVFISEAAQFSVITGCSLRSICLCWHLHPPSVHGWPAVTFQVLLFSVWHFIFLFFLFYSSVLRRTNGRFKDMEWCWSRPTSGWVFNLVLASDVSLTTVYIWYISGSTSEKVYIQLGYHHWPALSLN